jgi:hypothetical protein
MLLDICQLNPKVSVVWCLRETQVLLVTKGEIFILRPQVSPTQWIMPVILALGRLRDEDQALKDKQAEQDLVLRKQNKTIRNPPKFCKEMLTC